MSTGPPLFLGLSPSPPNDSARSSRLAVGASVVVVVVVVVVVDEEELGAEEVVSESARLPLAGVVPDSERDSARPSLSLIVVGS